MSFERPEANILEGAAESFFKKAEEKMRKEGVGEGDIEIIITDLRGASKALSSAPIWENIQSNPDLTVDDFIDDCLNFSMNHIDNERLEYIIDGLFELRMEEKNIIKI